MKLKLCQIKDVTWALYFIFYIYFYHLLNDLLVIFPVSDANPE